jgi:kynurenine formamidase
MPGFVTSSQIIFEAFKAYGRNDVCVDVETIGTDARQAGQFGLASLCNLDQRPATGAAVTAAPLSTLNGSKSPLRDLAIAPA